MKNINRDIRAAYEQNFADYKDTVPHLFHREKDRVTIEQTFEDLMQFEKQMGEEQNRAAREGLDEESLALFDLLKKPKLSPREIKRIKAVAVNLLKTIKNRISRIDHWTTREASGACRQPAGFKFWKFFDLSLWFV